ncbi:hypothetical protein ASC80_12000 [Afipia sp. Root123D2]|nr:hypothetical protein ASC80_12000 [Afipia sp. Root123D2]
MTEPFRLSYADPQTDPHDAIVAQLRDLAPRVAHKPADLNVTPAAVPEAASETPGEPPLHVTNDNIGDIRIPTTSASTGRRVVLFVVCIGIAAAAAWHFYGQEAKRQLSDLVPQLLAGISAPAQNANAADPQDTANAQATAPHPERAADPAPAQQAADAAPATPAEPAAAPSTQAVETVPAQAAIPPELAQSIESMANEIASLRKTVEELQTGQQQLSRDVAKVTEHEARRKLPAKSSKPAPPPRPQRASTPAAAPPRAIAPAPPPAYRQEQTYRRGSVQHDAYVPPPAPAQLPPQPGDASAPRPPMPLR